MTRSPLYSIYGETITGVAVVRAFGASSKFLRDMLRFTDTVCRSTVPLMFADDDIEIICRMPAHTTGSGEVRALQYLYSMSVVVDVKPSPVNRWLATRYCLLSASVIGAIAFIAVYNPKIDASLAGFTLAFASSLQNDVSTLRHCRLYCTDPNVLQLISVVRSCFS